MLDLYEESPAPIELHFGIGDSLGQPKLSCRDSGRPRGGFLKGL
jgi:hypothetical protein